jgi:predicted transposase YdaD
MEGEFEGEARGRAEGKIEGMQEVFALLEQGVSLADAKKKLGLE